MSGLIRLTRDKFTDTNQIMQCYDMIVESYKLTLGVQPDHVQLLLPLIPCIS